MTDSEGQIAQDGAEAAAAKALRDRIDENADGSLVLKLHHPVTFEGADIERLTMRKITVFALRKVVNDKGTYNALDMACVLALPEGAADKLDSAVDADLLVLAVQTQMGKYQRASQATGS